jgi:hypothetical protein
MAKSNYVCGMSPEEIKSQLENQFDNSSWEDIMQLINQVNSFNIPDATVDSILNYVGERNKISFKQWKVLKNYIRHHERSREIKFKYGK